MLFGIRLQSLKKMMVDQILTVLLCIFTSVAFFPASKYQFLISDSNSEHEFFVVVMPCINALFSGIIARSIGYHIDSYNHVKLYRQRCYVALSRKAHLKGFDFGIYSPM